MSLTLFMKNQEDEDMFHWNLFWGLYCLAFAVPCWICAYVFGLRKSRLPARCIRHTTGKIVRYSSIQYSGVRIPLVEYQAGGRTYRVAGPKFLSVTVKRITTPFEDPQERMETNLTTREALPVKLRIKIRSNSLIRLRQSPLTRLYPVGGTADVYYNPDRPREAFVQRHEGVCRWLVVLFLCFAAALTIGGAAILVGPEIVMR